MYRHNGFTLVELLIVIIIVGVLMGMMMISSDNAIDLTKKNKCLANRKTLKSGLNVKRALHGTNTFTVEMVEELKKMFDNPIGEVSISGQMLIIEGLCPIGGVYTVKEKDSKVYVVCNLKEHGGGLTGQEIADALISDPILLEYFAGRSDGSKLDSEAPTISTVTTGKAELINNALKALGVDIDNVSWQVHKVGNSYHVYITDSKITSSSIGQRVNVTKYNFVNGKTTIGTIKVAKSERADYPILDTVSFRQKTQK